MSVDVLLHLKKPLQKISIVKMLKDINKNRYNALCLVADHISPPSREMRLDAIIRDVPDEDLRWVLDRLHYFLLKIIEDSDYDPAEDIENLNLIGLID